MRPPLVRVISAADAGVRGCASALFLFLKSVCRNDRNDVAVLVELHDIDAHFSVYTRTIFKESRIDAVIDDAPVITIGNLGALFALLIL